jgi:hypothetical protein
MTPCHANLLWVFGLMTFLALFAFVLGRSWPRS